SSESGGKISLLDTIKHGQPTILIGVSAQPGTFTKEIVQTMASYTEQPIIFPLSNPTSRAEATADQLIQWTQGKAIIATGSPFPPVLFKEVQYHIAQCNNVYIFPGVGLGVVACKTPRVTEEMFIRAAQVLSSHAPILHDPSAPIFPSLEKLRTISREIAIAVCQVA
ncbi:MAG: malic enzyme-like NAD(P)-binding protein, partial [Chlamydiota bacterium]